MNQKFRKINLILVLGLLLISVKCSISFDNRISNQKELINEFVWFNRSSSNSLMDEIFFPKVGYATYYSSQSYSQTLNEAVPKKYFTLSAGYSQFWNTLTLICEVKGIEQRCDSIEFQHIFKNLQIKQATGGQLILDDKKIKIIKWSENSQIQFYQRQSYRQMAQFWMSTFVLLMALWSLFTLDILKYSKSYFLIQFYVSIGIIIVQFSQYLREAIQNWNNQSWKFWAFFPLILLVYKLMQQIIQKLMSRKLNLKHLSISLLINFILYNYLSDSCAYPVINLLLIFNCEIDCLLFKQQFGRLQKYIIKKYEKQGQLTFMIINLKLLFKKQSFYLIDRCPTYFFVGFGGILLILALQIIRQSAKQKAEQLQQNRYKIKVIGQKCDLLMQIPQYSISQKLNQQCAICYQIIESNWAKTPCNHVFHDYCLHKWLSKSQTCPIDRQRILKD